MAAPRPTRKRSQRIQIYLTPSVEKDKVVLDVWKAAEAFDRPPDLFRQIVYEGIRALAERGDLPPKVAEAARVDERVGVRKAAGAGTTVIREVPVPMPMPYPQAPGWWQGPASHHAPHPGHEAAPVHAPAPAAPPIALQPQPVVQVPPLEPRASAPAPSPVRASSDEELPDFLLADAPKAPATASVPASPAKTRKAASPSDRFLGLMALGD